MLALMVLYNAHEMLSDETYIKPFMYHVYRENVIYVIYNIFIQIKTVYERNII